MCNLDWFSQSQSHIQNFRLSQCFLLCSSRWSITFKTISLISAISLMLLHSVTSYNVSYNFPLCTSQMYQVFSLHRHMYVMLHYVQLNHSNYCSFHRQLTIYVYVCSYYMIMLTVMLAMSHLISRPFNKSMGGKIVCKSIIL